MSKHQWDYQQFKWTDLTPQNKQLLETIELDFMPVRKSLQQLNEYVELTPNTIGKIFSNAEELSKEKKLRTDFGKNLNLPKDSIDKVNNALGSFGKRLQDSSQVKMFDEKFDQAKAQMRTYLERTNSGRKTLSLIDTLGNAAKEHPLWQAAILGLLIGASTFAAGPAGALIVGPILKGAAELVKGEKLSTAVGKGIYVGALGFLTANVAGGLSHWFEGVRIAHIAPVGPRDLGFEQVTFTGSLTQPGHGFQWTKWFKLSDITVDPEMKNAIRDTILRMGNGDFSAYDDLLRLAKKVASPEYLAGLKSQLASAALDAQNQTLANISNDGFLASIKQVGKYAMAASAGTVAGAASVEDKVPPSVSTNNTQQPTQPSLAQTIQNAKLRISNGNLPIDAKKDLLHRAVQAKIKLTNKPNLNLDDQQNIRSIDQLINMINASLSNRSVTEGLSRVIMEGLWADLTLQFGVGKLKKAWDASGKPTDSTSIARMLADMGMETEDIKHVMIRSGVPAEDVDETIKELSGDSDESELNLPFVSGIASLDNEAKRIFKFKGKDSFILYWEQKIGELEKDLKDKEVPPTETPPIETPPIETPPTQPATEPTDPANASLDPEYLKTLEPEKSAAAPVTTASPSVGKKQSAKVVKKPAITKAGIKKKLASVTTAKKRKISELLDSSPMTNNTRIQIREILDRSSIAEVDIFENLSMLLKSNNLTWKQLGFQKIILERRTNSVILL